VFLLLSIEIYFRNVENAFKIKAEFHKRNLNEIETLFLGSSHTQNGVNPRFLKSKSSNLSFGSQDIQLDSALFFSYIPKMSNLKNVVVELDYHRLDLENNADYYRYSWYHIYHDIEIHPIKFHKKLSLYASSPSFFNSNFISSLKRDKNKQVFNEYGYVEKNYIDHFTPLHHDKLVIKNSAIQRLSGRHIENFPNSRNRNKNRLNAIINYCKKTI